MSTIKVMKFGAFAAAALMLAGCSQQSVLVDTEYGKKDVVNRAVEFGISLPENQTRGAKSVGNSFVAGDQFTVEGYQSTGSDVFRLFEGQVVTFDGDQWTYSPVKYWNIGSSYDFYAFYPSTLNHSFSADRIFSVDDFEVASDPQDQTDIMISRPNINASPYNTVQFVFTHILCDVNFYLKAAESFNTDGIEAIEVVSFDIYGVNGKGTYAQSSWTNNAAEGGWTIDNSVKYVFPTSNGVFTIGGEPLSLASDLLLIPQDIPSDAMVKIVYKLKYTDGTMSLFTKQAGLAAVAGVMKTDTEGNLDVVIAKWQPRYRYNYYLAINPSVNEFGGDTSQPNGVVGYDSDDADKDKPAGVDIIVDKDDEGNTTYAVDEDRDGIPDYDLVWSDPNGDGTEELYPDHDGDGIPDYLDDDFTGNSDADGDGNPDATWVDTDGDGESETLLERAEDGEEPYVPQYTISIQFYGTAEDWSSETDLVIE